VPNATTVETKPLREPTVLIVTFVRNPTLQDRIVLAKLAVDV
jgi:hypothetical protein